MADDIDTDAIWADIQAKAKKQKDAAAAASTPGSTADQIVAKLRAQTSAAPESATGDPDLDAIWADIQTKAQKQAAAAQPSVAAPGAPSPTQAPSTSTWTGVGKNIAAGVGDGVAGFIDLLRDPSGALGQGAANIAVSLHDAINPLVGPFHVPDSTPVFGGWVGNGQRFTPEQRAFLLGDQLPQPGPALVDKAATAVGLPAPSNVPANGVTEQLARKIAGAGTGGALVGPGAVIPSVTGAVTGDAVSRAVPDWAKPGVETVGNLLGAAPSGWLQDRVVKPYAAINPGVADDAALARDVYGIQLRRPQLNPTSATVDKATGYLPLSGHGSEVPAIRDQWQRSISQLIGEDTPLINDQTLQSAQTRIGAGLDHHEANTTLKVDQGLIDRLAKIESDAQSSLTDPEYRVIKNQIDGVLKNVQPGDTIDGSTVANLIGHKSPLSTAAARANDNIAGFAGDIKGAIQDGLARSMTPDDFQDYTNLRARYKDLMLLKPLVAVDNSGNISPQAFDQAVRKSYGVSVVNALPGDNPAYDLARIGRLVPEPGPSIKNTPLAGPTKMATVGLGVADQLLPYLGLSEGAHYVAPIAAAGVGVNRLLGAYLRSKGAANRLIDSGGTDNIGAPVPTAFGQSLLVPGQKDR